jgi:thiamine biosynthesis lipoprotein
VRPGCRDEAVTVTRRTELLMGGIPFTIETTAPAEHSLLDSVFGHLRWIEQTLSPFIADSATSRLNAGDLEEADAIPMVREVLALCRKASDVTDGYFSAWIDGYLDPCGLVKGHAIARACQMLDAAGHRAYLVDGGGDVYARGEREPGYPWRVAIRHPVERDRVIDVLVATDLAVATSGTYERGAHIHDPHTRRAAVELVSLTVIGPDVMWADVYATAAFAMGRRGLDFIESRDGYEAIAIDAEMFAAATAGYERLALPLAKIA